MMSDLHLQVKSIRTTPFEIFMFPMDMILLFLLKMNWQELLWSD